MQRAILLSALATAGLPNLSTACSFHAPQDSVPVINNVRRSQPGPTTRTAVENIRVFDGWHFTLPQTICLDSGWIVDDDGCVGAGAKINGTGKFLIPGLIDAHLHMATVQGLENFTSYGGTTALNMNCANATQCEIMRNQPGLATYLSAGRSSVGINSAHEASDPTRPKDTLIYPDTNVTKVVEDQFNSGADFHKITAEVNGSSVEQQIEMVQAAHSEYRKQTMTHASAILSYNQSAESMTDAIQHVPDDGILDSSIIQIIKAQNQYVTPTLNVFEYSYGQPAFEKYFGVQEGGNRTLEHALTNARLLYEAGVPLITGTDSVGVMSAAGTTLEVPYGLTLHYELEHFVNIVGMAPAEALNAATREAAKWHRLSDRGSIEVGKRADLVMLNSNPLVNITNTRDVERVWVAGIEVSYVSKLAASSSWSEVSSSWSSS